MVVYLFLAVGSSLLHELFSSCGVRGLLSSCAVRAPHCDGFSCCRARDPGPTGFSSWSDWTLEHRAQ